MGRIRRFIERGIKGYCYEDLWSWDNFFSGLIARSIKEFKDKTHSYPGNDISWEEWMAILEEIVECFQEQNRDIENVPTTYTEDGNAKLDMSLYHKRMAHKKKMLSRGLELLESYYYDLWD